jgi:hypothetical protein
VRQGDVKFALVTLAGLSYICLVLASFGQFGAVGTHLAHSRHEEKLKMRLMRTARSHTLIDLETQALAAEKALDAVLTSS